MPTPSLNTNFNASVNPLHPSEPQQMQGQEDLTFDAGGHLLHGVHNWRVTHLNRGRIEVSDHHACTLSKGKSPPFSDKLPSIAAKALKLGAGIAIKTIPLLISLV